VIIHSIRQFVDVNVDNKNMAIALEDLEKCFQNLKRETWLPVFHEKLPMLSPMLHDQYTKTNNVVFDGHVITSSEGFAQGDAKGPLGCSLATAENTMASTELLKRNSDDFIAASYLDDLTKGSTEENVCASVQFTIDNGPKNGEILNKSKTLIIPVSVLHGKPAPPAPANFPVGVTRVTNAAGIEIGKKEDSGTRMLGSPLGTPEFCQRYFLNRLEKTKAMYKVFAEIEHPHVVKHLMDRTSITNGFMFLYRTVRPDDILEILDQIADVQRSLFEQAIVGKSLSDLQWSIAQLPFSMGGWNLIPPKVLSICGFIASLASCKDQIMETRPNAKSWIETQLDRATVLLNQLIPSAKPIEITSTTKQRDLVKLVMKARYDSIFENAPADIRALLYGESRPHAYAWKTAPPLPNLILAANEFRFAVRRSLRVEIFTSPFLCPEHPNSEDDHEINRFGDHCLHCAPGGGLVHRHNDSYREIVKVTRQALLSCSTEVVETFADGTTYRADIVISQPILGLTKRKGAFDFTITNLFAKTYIDNAAKEPGYAIKKGVERKKKEVNINGLMDRGYDFKALSFETTGGCNDETDRLVNYILTEKALVHNKPFSELVSEFWTLISILIQRSNAQMIAKRLPSIETFM
jgi:hypothetical protein